MPKEIRDMNMNAGYNACDARMKILKNETVQKDLDYDEIKVDDVKTNSFVYVSQGGSPTKIKLASLLDPKEGIQSDWEEKDVTSLAYIKNKPLFYTENELIAAYSLGGIKRGDTIPAGSTALDILVRMFTANESVAFRFGVLDSIETIRVDNLTLQEPIKLEEALTKGYFIDDVHLDNQFYVFAVPENSGIVVDSVYQGGYKISFKYRQAIDSRDNSWKVYYQTVPSTGAYNFRYKFKEQG